MTTAREVMTARPATTNAADTVLVAARRMRDLDVSMLPVCDADDRLTGMLTDRDIVVRSVASGDDPTTTTVASLTCAPVVSIGADESVEQALRSMIEHAVRRLPVTDHGRLVGMVSQSAVTRSLPSATVRRVVARASHPA